MDPKCPAVQCIVNGEEIVTVPEEDRATATCTKIVEDRACVFGDILADRQTHRHTDTHTDVVITILRNRNKSFHRD